MPLDFDVGCKPFQKTRVLIAHSEKISSEKSSSDEDDIELYEDSSTKFLSVKNGSFNLILMKAPNTTATYPDPNLA